MALHYLNLYSVHLGPLEEWVGPEAPLLFLFVESGAAEVKGCSEGQTLNPGDVLFLKGVGGARLCAPFGKEAAFSYFAAGPAQLVPLCTGQEVWFIRDLLDSRKRCKLYPAASPVASECLELVRHLNVSEHNIAHRSQLLRIAGTILSAELDLGQSRRCELTRGDEHLVLALESLSVDEILNLSGDELARRFHCSRRHLSRLFQEHFGVSVGTLRMEMRLLKAASLLHDPEAKVINIAEESGFNHLGLFNTCFKRRFGVTPTRWRQDLQGAPVRAVASHPGADPTCRMREVGLCPWQTPANGRNNGGHRASECGGHTLVTHPRMTNQRGSVV